jgi:hypothetical protein
MNLPTPAEIIDSLVTTVEKLYEKQWLFYGALIFFVLICVAVFVWR